MSVDWPSELVPHSGGFAPDVRNLGGGQSLSGFEQVVGSRSDRWQASYTFRINSDAKVLALRAFFVQARGRLNTILLPAFDLARAPWPKDIFGRTISPKFVRNNQLDRTPYPDSPSLRDSLVVATIAAAANAGAGVVQIAVTQGARPQAGHLFSIGERLYTIVTISGDGPYTCSIWPALRANVAAGSAANFTSPVCLVRQQTDAAADALHGLDQLRFGNVTLSFDEAPASL